MEVDSSYSSNCHSSKSLMSCGSSSYDTSIDLSPSDSTEPDNNSTTTIAAVATGLVNTNWLTSIADWNIQQSSLPSSVPEDLPRSVLGGHQSNNRGHGNGNVMGSETGLLETSYLLGPLPSTVKSYLTNEISLSMSMDYSSSSSFSSSSHPPSSSSSPSAANMSMTTVMEASSAITAIAAATTTISVDPNPESVLLSGGEFSLVAPIENSIIIEERGKFGGQSPPLWSINQESVTERQFGESCCNLPVAGIDTPYKTVVTREQSDLSLPGSDDIVVVESSSSRPTSPAILKANLLLNGGIFGRRFAHWNRQTSLKKGGGHHQGIMKRSFSEFIDRRGMECEDDDYHYHEGSTLNFSLPINEICCIIGSAGTDIEYVLPCHDSPRDAIKRITPTTMTQLLAGQFVESINKVLIVDCRYPYEYHGGHLPGAVNVCTSEEIDMKLFNDATSMKAKDDRPQLIVFHCEFSSERAPRMALHVRNRDRTLNADKYPSLLFPQLYILEGGYRAFFLQYPQNCEPPGHYVPMRTTDHRDELRYHQRLRHFGDGKHRHKLRSCSLKRSHSLAVPQPTLSVASYYKHQEFNGTAFETSPANASTALAILSSDIGDICEQSECSFLRAAESVLLTAFDDGRASK